MRKINDILKIFCTSLGKSVILNLVYMGGMLLLFTPFLQVDDYVMSEYAYGAFGDDYDYCVRYENFIYGRLITGLMRIFPKVPWYTVLFYLWVFMALTLFCYIILEQFNNYLGMVLANIFLLFFSYEGYVSIQFTKVAGIIGTVGIFSLMCSKSSWKSKTAGMILFFMAGLIRYDVIKMILGAWICALILKSLYELVVFRKMQLRKKHVIGIGISILFFLLIPHLPQYSSLEEKEFWKLYWDYNAVRSSIQDYKAYLPYEEKKEEYDDAGISANDLYLWYSWNMDADAMTVETVKKIWAIKNGTYEFSDSEKNIEKAIETEEAERKDVSKKIEETMMHVLSMVKNFFGKYNLKSILSFLKEFPGAFLNIDVCFCLILVVMLIFLCCKLNSSLLLEAFVVMAGVLFALNYYLFVGGRYLQHRVDVGIFIVVCSIFIFVLFENGNIEVLNVKKMVACSLASCLIIVVPSQYYIDDRKTVSKETIETNRILYEQYRQDKNACYYFVSDRQRASTEMRQYYDVFDVPEVGSARNCFFSNTIYDKKRMKELFGIEQIFVDMLDNDDIYFVMADTDANLTAWETYLTEHNGKEVELVLVKDYLGRKIYKAKSLEKALKVPRYIKESENVISDITAFAITDGKICLDGNVHLKGETGFIQDSYIQIIDSQTKQTETLVAVQTCDANKTYGEDGYFSSIHVNAEMPEFYDKRDIVNFIIEQEGKYYCLKLS